MPQVCCRLMQYLQAALRTAHLRNLLQHRTNMNLCGHNRVIPPAGLMRYIDLMLCHCSQYDAATATQLLMCCQANCVSTHCMSCGALKNTVVKLFCCQDNNFAADGCMTMLQTSEATPNVNSFPCAVQPNAAAHQSSDRLVPTGPSGAAPLMNTESSDAADHSPTLVSALLA